MIFSDRDDRFLSRCFVLASAVLSILLNLALCLPVAAELLDFVTVQRQALERSFALKIADSDVELRKIDHQEALTHYFPTLALRYDFGYAWTLDSQQETVAIGDTVSSTDTSTWRNSLSVSTSLLLYDGGARKQNVLKAEHALHSAWLFEADQLQQVRLQALDTYVQAFQAQRKAEVSSAIVCQRTSLFRVLEQLQKAGIVGRAQLQDEALRLAASLARLDDVRRARQLALAALTELTGRQYTELSTHLAPLPEMALPQAIPLSVAQLPQIRVIDEELAALRAERAAAWSGQFPTLGLYGNYRLYGADPGYGKQALEDLSGRDATLAVVMQWEFSGFRSQLHVARLDEQLRRLSWQRQQKIAELERKVGGLQQVVERLPEDLAHLQTLRLATADSTQSTQRLREQGFLSELEALTHEIERLETNLEEELQRHQQQADGLRLQIWQEGLDT